MKSLHDRIIRILCGNKSVTDCCQQLCLSLFTIQRYPITVHITKVPHHCSQYKGIPSLFTIQRYPITVHNTKVSHHCSQYKGTPSLFTIQRYPITSQYKGTPSLFAIDHEKSYRLLTHSQEHVRVMKHIASISTLSIPSITESTKFKEKPEKTEHFVI